MEKTSVNFTAKITPLKPVNDEFTLCKCYIMALGKNHNKSIISKEAADDAMPTLFNIPVVGHIYVDESGEYHMGGHDMKIEPDDKGSFHFKTLTVPYGTIPYQDNAHYEEVVEKDGTQKAYLVADMILWTGRYPELLSTIYNSEVYFNQSMEIAPLEIQKVEDNYTDIKKYTYSALCLLGKSDDITENVEPCFSEARVEPYVFSRVDNWDELIEELETKFKECFGGGKAFEEGGKTLEIEQLEKANEVVEDGAQEEIAEFTAEKPAEEEEKSFTSEADVVADTVETSNATPPAQPDETASGDVEVVFAKATTYEEKRDALCSALSGLNVNGGNTHTCYYLCDFDDAYVYSQMFMETNETCARNYVRFSYSVESNGCFIDESTRTNVALRFLTDEDIDKLNERQTEYEELAEFKTERLNEDKRKAYGEAIAEFNDISALEEYSAVVGRAMEFESVDTLKEKLYAIRGKYASSIGKNSKQDVKPIPLDFAKHQENDKNQNSIDGDSIPEYEREFFAKYSPKNK